MKSPVKFPKRNSRAYQGYAPPSALELPTLGATQISMVEATPKAQTAPSVERPPKEKVALASKGLNFSTAKDKAPATEERIIDYNRVMILRHL